MESKTPAADWLVWQLADSAFPVGGFAHSAGLEAAWQHGEIRNREEFASYLETSLVQAGHAMIPFLTAAHQSPGRFEELDEFADAFLTGHVANRASRLQGRSLKATAIKVFGVADFPCSMGHHAPVFGLVCRLLEISRDDAGQLFLFNHLRTLGSAAVRLGIVGPMEAQRMQHSMTPLAKQVWSDCATIPVEEAAQTAPLLDLWQSGQDRLYSRLFQS